MTKTYGLTSPGVWGWILMAVSGTWVNDHLIWMSSLFSSMWNSIYENKPPRNSYWVVELITWALISSYVHASVPCTRIFMYMCYICVHVEYVHRVVSYKACMHILRICCVLCICVLMLSVYSFFKIYFYSMYVLVDFCQLDPNLDILWNASIRLAYKSVGVLINDWCSLWAVLPPPG